MTTFLDDNERKVADFLNKIGFSLQDSHSEFKKSEAETAVEIDLLFTYQNCLFIIEVSTVKTNRNKKIIAFMYSWSKRKNLERLKEKYPAIPNKVMRIFFDLSKPIPENKSREVEELTEEHGNRVIYKDEFEKLNLNENIEQTIIDFLGSNWLENCAKMDE